MKTSLYIPAILLILLAAGIPAGCKADKAEQTAEKIETAPAPISPAGKKTAAETAPEMFMPERSYQFSNVVAGQYVSHDYIIKNRGTAPLHVNRVKTG